MDNKIVLLVGITAGIAAAVYLLYQELRKQRTQIRDQNLQIRALLQQSKRVEGLIYTYNIDQLEGMHPGPTTRRDTRTRTLSSHIFPMEESMRDMIYVWNEDDKNREQPQQLQEEKDEDILNHDHGLEHGSRHRRRHEEESDSSETSNSHSSDSTDSSDSEDESDSTVPQQSLQALQALQAHHPQSLQAIQAQQHRFRPHNPTNLIPPSHLFRPPGNMNIPQQSQRFPRVPRMVSSHLNHLINPTQPHQPHQPHLIRQQPHQPHPQHIPRPHQQPHLQHQQQRPPQMIANPPTVSVTTQTAPNTHTEQRSYNQRFAAPDGSAVGIVSVTTTETETVNTQEPALEDIKTFDVSSESSEEETPINQAPPIVDIQSEEDEKDSTPITSTPTPVSTPTHTQLTLASSILGGATESVESTTSIMGEDKPDKPDKPPIESESDSSSNTKKTRYYKDTPANRKLNRVGEPY